MNRLLEIGFQKVGNWCIDIDNELVFRLTDMYDDNNIIYAFTSDNDIKYIGKTTQPLNRRMVGYQRPGRTQTTNIKNHAFIKDLLNKGKVVDIFALRDNGFFHYGSYHINLAAGLEDGLIAAIKPDWNRSPSLPLINTIKKGVIKEAINTSDRTSNIVDVILRNISNDSACNALTQSKSICYNLILHKTYFNKGFFNVGVEYARHFGNDLEKINIFCNGENVMIIGHINRSANKNNTPRIMGGVQLKRWFQQNVGINGKFCLEILSPTSIRISEVVNNNPAL
ncbi:MAG: GIY-YIG nuclease family protein [Chlorobium sp.]